MMGEEADQIEVGAGWKRVGEKAGAYVAVQIDDPAFACPLRANLFQADARSHVLLWNRSEEHTSELQSLMRISYAVFCLKKKNKNSYYKQRRQHTYNYYINSLTECQAYYTN